MNKIAIVTGATSGIGRATSKLLALNGFDVIITGRRLNLLQEVDNEIKNVTNSKVHILNFDIRNEASVIEAISSLPENWKKIDVLINNAGLASGLEPINEGLSDDWNLMIDTNIKGLLYISKIVSNLMIKENKGHIINVSSIAGKEAYANGSVYCGSKHAVEAISKSMRLDLLKYNIKVGTISPGMVETEFSVVRFHGDISKANSVYEGFTPLCADDIAESILFMVTRPKHVNIDDIFVTPTAQGLTRNVNRKTPTNNR